MLFLVFVVIILILFYVGRGPAKVNAFSVARKVTVERLNGRYNFYKNGQLFLVKGGVGTNHISEIASCGGNTVTCWDTTKLELIMQQALNCNMSVIIGLDIPDGKNIDYYNNTKNTSQLLAAYRRLINKYKDHPTLLAYCLGNELSFPFSLTETMFYKTYNNFLRMINEIDPNHPVSTSVINVAKKNIINIKWRIPGLDFICINTYNRTKTLPQDLNAIKFIWEGPYLVSEWAPGGGWEAETSGWNAPIENTSTKKAEQYYYLYKNYMPLKDPRFLGSMVFYWGNRNEYTHTWYSIFNDDEIPTEIKEALYDCWKDTITDHHSPLVNFMLIDSLGARDNIILDAGSKHIASISLQKNQPSDSIYFKWEILNEDWLNWGRTWSHFNKPIPFTGLITDSARQVTDFASPSKEGLYRIFVTVYNDKGYCATSNTPFYVVTK